MKKLNVEGIRKYLNEFAKKQKLEILENSSTVSWLYPGQFAYCLNEEFIWDRYGTFINMPGELSFHKIQPVIRWDDFIEYFQKSKNNKNKVHLGLFDMTTINGGHVVSKEKFDEFSEKIIKGTINFLVEELGLSKENLVITYFPGGKLSEMSKNRKGEQKYDFDFDFPQDEKSKKMFLDLGIKENQLKKVKSRDCFLIPNWACGEPAPWGYRNEIHYKTKEGLLDIATVERLCFKPIIKNDKISGVEEWDKVFIINGTGIERLSMLLNGHKDIYDVSNIKKLWDYIKKKNYKNSRIICESIRILNRLIADTKGNMYDSRSKKSPKERKRKFNIIRANLMNLDKKELKEMLEINSKINSWYPKLRSSINKTLENLGEYVESKKDWKEKRKNKNG